MQQKGVELFRVVFFWRGRLQHIYIHGDLCLTFYFTFDYFWLLICFLTFCSLWSNQMTDKGASTLAAALQVNQSLQELKWVQPCMSLYFLKSVHCSGVPRYVLKFIVSPAIHVLYLMGCTLILHLSTFDFLFVVFWHSAALGPTRSQTKVLAQ